MILKAGFGLPFSFSLHKARSLEAQIHAIMNAPIPGATPRAPQNGTLPTEPNSTAPTSRTAQSSALPDEPNCVARNAPCPCGSGLKYKRCCGRS